MLIKILLFQVSRLPSSDRVSYLFKQSWNEGVKISFSFLGNLPNHINNWSGYGLQAIADNVEIRKLTNSLTPTNNDKK